MYEKGTRKTLTKLTPGICCNLQQSKSNPDPDHLPILKYKIFQFLMDLGSLERYITVGLENTGMDVGIMVVPIKYNFSEAFKHG